MEPESPKCLAYNRLRNGPLDQDIPSILLSVVGLNLSYSHLKVEKSKDDLQVGHLSSLFTFARSKGNYDAELVQACRVIEINSR